VDESAWNAGFLCEEHGESFCPMCRPKSLSTVVYVTAGGQAFHRSLDCEALQDGQHLVAKRGGTPADPTSVSVSAAKRDGREPCLVCWPRESTAKPDRSPRSRNVGAKRSRQVVPKQAARSHSTEDTGGVSLGGSRSAEQLWDVASRQLRDALESAARRRQTMTYTDAAKAVRCMDLDATSTPLVHLLCQQVREDAANNLPLLSSLVIGRRRNQPGKGFFQFARQFFRFDDNERFWLAEVEAVYNHYGRRARRRGNETGVTHRVALPTPPEQRPEDQNSFIASFFD